MLPVSFGEIQSISNTVENPDQPLGYDSHTGEVFTVDTSGKPMQEKQENIVWWGSRMVMNWWYGTSGETGETQQKNLLSPMKAALCAGMDNYNELAALTGDRKLSDYNISSVHPRNIEQISVGFAKTISEQVLETKTGRLMEASTRVKRYLALLNSKDADPDREKIETIMAELFTAAKEAITDKDQLKTYITQTFKDEIGVIKDTNFDNALSSWSIIRQLMYKEFEPEKITPPSSSAVSNKGQQGDSGSNEEAILTDATEETVTVAKQLADDLELDENLVKSLRSRPQSAREERSSILAQNLLSDELRSPDDTSFLQEPDGLLREYDPEQLPLEPLRPNIRQSIFGKRSVSSDSDSTGTDVEDLLEEVIDESNALQENSIQNEEMILQSLKRAQQSGSEQSLHKSVSSTPQPSSLELNNPEESFFLLRSASVAGRKRHGLLGLRKREALEVPTLHPLSLDQRKKLRKTWDSEFERVHGVRVEKLPAYERRHLDNTFYHGCHKNNGPASKEEMAAVIVQHKPVAEQYISNLAEQLREHLPDNPPYSAGNLEKPLRDVANTLKLSRVQTQDMMAACRCVQNTAIPLLSNSCYDGAKVLEPRLGYMEKLADDVKMHQHNLNILYTHLVDNTDNEAAIALVEAMIRDLNTTGGVINDHIQHLKIIIANDFSQDAQLHRSQEYLVLSAIEALNTKEQELMEQLDPSASNQGKLKAALSSTIITRAMFQQELKELQARKPSGKMVANIVGTVKQKQKNITEQLAKVNVSKSAFREGMKKTMQKKEWPVLRSQMVMRHNGSFRTFDVETIPAGACIWNPEQGLVSSDTCTGKDVLKLDGKGFSSLDKDERQHAINAWVVRVHDPDTGKVVMSKVRSGVPVPFTMIAAKEPDDQIIEAACNRMRDIVAMMVLENPEYREQINAGQPIDFKAIHCSLLSPDKLRSLLNAASGLGGRPLQKIVGNTLENETQMNRYIQRAIEKLNREGVTFDIRNQDGSSRTVKVNYDGTMFACPANNMGQSGLYSVWSECDPINKAAATKLFGGTDPGQSLGGITGEYLDRASNQEEAELVERAARQIQFILHRNLHHDNQYLAVQLATLINTISQYIVDGNHDFCKSGKDRTGYVNMLCIVNHLEAYLSDYLLPALDAPVTLEQHQNRQCGMACTGQLNLIAENFCVPGAKINDPAGIKEVFYRAHHDSKKYARRVGRGS